MIPVASQDRVALWGNAGKVLTLRGTTQKPCRYTLKYDTKY